MTCLVVILTLEVSHARKEHAQKGIETVAWQLIVLEVQCETVIAMVAEQLIVFEVR